MTCEKFLSARDLNHKKRSVRCFDFLELIVKLALKGLEISLANSMRVCIISWALWLQDCKKSVQDILRELDLKTNVVENGKFIFYREHFIVIYLDYSNIDLLKFSFVYRLPII